jgi:hypothetical protein
MNSIVPWYYPSILSFFILLEKERLNPHRPLFHSQLQLQQQQRSSFDALDRCHSTTPPHRDALAVSTHDFIVVARLITFYHA